MELAGPAILGALNATEKVGTLQGCRPNENITCPEIVDTVRTDITNPTEQILSDDEMADTEDVETSLPEMAEPTSLTRQTRQEIEGGGEGVLQAQNHYGGSSLITTSDTREDRASATLMNVDISGQDDAVAGPSGGDTIAPDTDYEANDGNPEDHQYNVTPFSAVLAHNTSNTTMLELDQAAALRQMGVVLTNELYDGVLIPD